MIKYTNKEITENIINLFSLYEFMDICIIDNKEEKQKYLKTILNSIEILRGLQ